MPVTWKKLLSLGLCLLLCAAVLPSARAAEEDPVEVELAVSDWEGPSNDELFEAYLRRMFFGGTNAVTNSPRSLYETLGPTNYAIEQRLKAMIEQELGGTVTKHIANKANPEVVIED